jgi:ATP synthase protein I
VIDSARLFRATAPLLAIPPLPDDTDTPKGVEAGQGTEPEVSNNPDSSLEPQSSDVPFQAPLDDYERLQRRLVLATLIVSALAVAITALVFDLHIAGSLLVGALAGVLYLRLLARSVSKLGNGSKKVGKLQLLVPVVLVLAASRLPQLELLPALLGFLLYKPALILQAVLDS